MTLLALEAKAFQNPFQIYFSVPGIVFWIGKDNYNLLFLQENNALDLKFSSPLLCPA